MLNNPRLLLAANHVEDGNLRVFEVDDQKLTLLAIEAIRNGPRPIVAMAGDWHGMRIEVSAADEGVLRKHQDEIAAQILNAGDGPEEFDDGDRGRGERGGSPPGPAAPEPAEATDTQCAQENAATAAAGAALAPPVDPSDEPYDPDKDPVLRHHSVHLTSE